MAGALGTRSIRWLRANRGVSGVHTGGGRRPPGYGRRGSSRPTRMKDAGGDENLGATDPGGARFGSRVPAEEEYIEVLRANGRRRKRPLCSGVRSLGKGATHKRCF